MNSGFAGVFRKKLQNILNQTLPGSEAQNKMAPQYRGYSQEINYKNAAVLIALYKNDGLISFPLIQRAEDGYTHSGQISLPGGKVEKDESFIDAAIREAHEETGIIPEKVEIIGVMSNLKIPVSGFLVHPIIGYVEGNINWVLNKSEVQRIFSVSLQDLHKPENVICETRNFNNLPYNIPCFQFGKFKIWGATAMILSELKVLTETLAREP